MTGARMLAWGSSLAVGAAVIAGLIVAGAPANERSRRFDERRSEDLREIAELVDVYMTRSQTLPPNLDTLPSIMRSVRIVDPRTTKPYEYRVIDSARYELCAEFEHESEHRNFYPRDFSTHNAGRYCFPVTARKAER